MSRRYSSRTIKEHEEVYEQTVPWFYALPMPEPWDFYLWHQWPSAWAEVTLSVCGGVWRRQGAILYGAHRDKELRDDLHDWLFIKAVEMSGHFVPDPSHPNPQAQWGAYLRTALSNQARQHFTSVVGDWRHSKGQAAVEAHNRGIVSTDYLDDLEAEEGRSVARHALHGNYYGHENPLAVIVRLESLLENIADAERASDNPGVYSTNTSATGICYINLCTRKVYGNGMCETHWRQEWQLQSNLTNPCSIPGCGETHRGHGFCGKHLELHRRGSLDPQWHHLYQESRKPGRVPEYDNTTCLEDGCNAPVRAKGRCEKHYAAYRRANRPPCQEPGCDKPQQSRQLCPMHYQRWRREKRGASGKGGGGE